MWKEEIYVEKNKGHIEWECDEHQIEWKCS